MEQKKKIIVAVAAVLVLMVGLMAWKKSETKLSGRYKTDQSTQYILLFCSFRSNFFRDHRRRRFVYNNLI